MICALTLCNIYPYFINLAMYPVVFFKLLYVCIEMLRSILGWGPHNITSLGTPSQLRGGPHNIKGSLKFWGWGPHNITPLGTRGPIFRGSPKNYDTGSGKTLRPAKINCYGKIYYLWPFGSLLRKFQSYSFYDA